MKTQHIPSEILKERLSLVYCNLVQLNVVVALNMFSIGQICKENVHPFGYGVISQEVLMFAIG